MRFVIHLILLACISVICCDYCITQKRYTVLRPDMQLRLLLIALLLALVVLGNIRLYQFLAM